MTVRARPGFSVLTRTVELPLNSAAMTWANAFHRKLRHCIGAPVGTTFPADAAGRKDHRRIGRLAQRRQQHLRQGEGGGDIDMHHAGNQVGTSY